MGNEQFQKIACGFSGCVGGDIGSPDNPAVWVCGIEYGRSLDTPVNEALDYFFATRPVDVPPCGFKDWKDNLYHGVNQFVMKLLCVICRKAPPHEFERVAEEVQPFTDGKKGFFLLNLFPVPCHNALEWTDIHVERTGFPNKKSYWKWCSEHRFPEMRKWAANYAPKLILCVGVGYADDFCSAFGVERTSRKTESIESRTLHYGSAGKTLLVVVPFSTSQKGLNSHDLITTFGTKIRELMEHSGVDATV